MLIRLPFVIPIMSTNLETKYSMFRPNCCNSLPLLVSWTILYRNITTMNSRKLPIFVSTLSTISNELIFHIDFTRRHHNMWGMDTSLWGKKWQPYTECKEYIQLHFMDIHVNKYIPAITNTRYMMIPP